MKLIMTVATQNATTKGGDALHLIQYWDEQLLRAVRDIFRVQAMDGFWAGVSFLGNVGWIWIVMAVNLVIFRKTRPLGLHIAGGLLANVLVVNVVLKNAVARLRPYDMMTDWLPLIDKPKDFSFPSGHTSASFVVAFICLRLMPKQYGIPVLILASMIAFSRLYLGVHYPSDILGGVIIGYLIAGLALWGGRELTEVLPQLKTQ